MVSDEALKDQLISRKRAADDLWEQARGLRQRHYLAMESLQADCPHTWGKFWVGEDGRGIHYERCEVCHKDIPIKGGKPRKG